MDLLKKYDELLIQKYQKLEELIEKESKQTLLFKESIIYLYMNKYSYIKG